MKIFGLFFAVIVYCGTFGSVFAANPPAAMPEEEALLSCQATPAIKAVDPAYPGAEVIPASNRMARPEGKAENAPGEVVYLFGKVTDEDCIPVNNATVEIWQTGPDGGFHVVTPAELSAPGPVFAGAGRAVTDMVGRYGFITLFPAPLGNNAPRILVRITHPDFAPVTTAVYFSGDHRNVKDPSLLAIPAARRTALEAKVTRRTGETPGINATFNMVVKAKKI